MLDRPLIRLSALGLGFVLAPSPAVAQSAAPPRAKATADSSASARNHKPSFLSEGHKLSAQDAATKKEGTYVNGLPIVVVDPDYGFGFGAVGNVFWDGPRSDPFFEYAPYRQRVGAQVLFTTNGLQQHYIDYDAPYLAGMPVRLRANVQYERNVAANYYGRGVSTLRALSFPGAGRTYKNVSDYTSALRQLGPDNLTHTLYNKYDLEDPGLKASLEWTLLGGLIRLQMGFGFAYVRVRDLSGHSTVGDDPESGQRNVHAIQTTTRLREDCQDQHIVGCSGGLRNTLKLGLALDTRDYEPDPNTGVFVDLTGEFSSRLLGSAFDYARVTFAARGFVSPLRSLTDLVLAARAVYSVQSAGTPFFAMNTLAFTDVDRQGLGGLWTLRGYRQDRFVGPIASLLNFELRWTFVQFDLLSQHLALAIVPFLDTGRVFDRISDFTFKRWRSGAGGALHIAWNKATIINIDLGFSTEGTELYMDLGQQF